MGRRSARAILLDGQGRVLLIRRTKLGREPYWTTPGGGVEADDASIEAALHRELAEELGATTEAVCQVFLNTVPTDAGPAVEHYFVARLAAFDLSARTGSEFADPARGGYEVVRIPLTDADMGPLDLVPPRLKEFVLANREALLVAAGVLRAA
jgi:ADP-ribose pyrophosphatase YjhB (NUDIX family)